MIIPEGEYDYCDGFGRYAASHYKRLERPGDIDGRYAVIYPHAAPDIACSIFVSASQILAVQLFDRDQQPYVVWSDLNGHVVVTNLETVRTRLNEVGLGW